MICERCLKLENDLAAMTAVALEGGPYKVTLRASSDVTLWVERDGDGDGDGDGVSNTKYSLAAGDTFTISFLKGPPHG